MKYILLILIFFSYLQANAGVEYVSPRFSWNNPSIKLTGEHAEKLFNWLPFEAKEEPLCEQVSEDDAICDNLAKMSKNTHSLNYLADVTGRIDCLWNRDRDSYACWIDESTEHWSIQGKRGEISFAWESSDLLGKIIGTTPFSGASGINLYCTELIPNRTYDCFFQYVED